MSISNFIQSPPMDPQKVLLLFDSLWFEPHLLQNPDFENEVKAAPEEAISSSTSGSLSPNSVLSSSSLFSESTDSENSKHPQLRSLEKKIRSVRKTGRRLKSERKSLSQLEYEEVKGFMDLGFVFSEKDKNSSLASVVPGLHRLWSIDSKEEEEIDDGSKISSGPYLSEVWEVLDRRRKEKALLRNWRLPCLSNEVDMKENLRWWAHAVASTVR